MRFLITSLLLIIVFIGFFHPVNAINDDLGRHLKLGEIIIQTHSIPKTNLLSYTYPNSPFINHHWLPEVIYSIIFQSSGVNGLLILNTLLILLSFGLIVLFAYKRFGGIVTIFCSLLYIPIFFGRTEVRPESFSFLFLSLFIIILYKFRERFTRLIFLIPLMELFWVNMHIYFPIGIFLVQFFFLDYLFLKQFKVSKQTLTIFSVLILTAIATLINPNGINGALYPFLIFQNYGYSVNENQSIFHIWSFRHFDSLIFIYMAVLILSISTFLSSKRMLIVDWLISIFFTAFAVAYIRNIPLFIFATFIPLAKSTSGIVLRLPNSIKSSILSFLLGLALFETQQNYLHNGFGFGLNPWAKDAVDFFIKQDLRGPIFNNFDMGSYLAYRLYPNEKVFVDQRPEAYPVSFFKEIYVPMQKDKNKFEQVDGKYNFNTIFLSPIGQTPWSESFLEQISQNNKWSLVYLDNFTVIWTKDKKIKPIIKTDYSDKMSLLRLGIFFRDTNLMDQEIKIYQKILNLDSDFCPTLYGLPIKLQGKQDLPPVLKDKFQKNCKTAIIK